MAGDRHDQAHRRVPRLRAPDGIPRTGPTLGALVLLLLLPCLAVALSWLAAPPADCAWCPPSPCLSDASCADCTCLITGDETRGRCVARARAD